MSETAAILENSAEFFLEYGIWGLISMSFIESVFFPIPTDVVLIPLSLLNPKMALWYALAATIASVTGGIAGYLIGQRAGRPLLEKSLSQKRIARIDAVLTHYGGWGVAIAGFTPIPYKFFTIASGIVNIKMTTFIIASVVSRGARFFIEGLLIFMIGEQAAQLLDKYLETGTVIITLVLILAYLAFRYRTRFIRRK